MSREKAPGMMAGAEIFNTKMESDTEQVLL